MGRNQLPEGVGKKIVEALKRQAEADIQPVEADDNNLSNDIPLTDIQDIPNLGFEQEKTDDTYSNDNVIVEEDNLMSVPDGVYKSKEEEKPVSIEQKTESILINNAVNEIPLNSAFSSVNMPKTEEIKSTITTMNGQINIPQNVAKLQNMVASLPVGVTKQTGAQIIKQFFDVMGLPMTNVLKEAQEVQEELNSSSRECMLKIQEYKTKILQLEQSVQECQKNITQLNDLVSLFLLSDRK